MSSPALDTMTLIEVVPSLLKPSNFLLDRFFGSIAMSQTEKVAIDVEIGKRRMAPLCSPLVAGKLVEGRRMQTNEIVPAYIKDLRTPDLRKATRRAIGERIGGGDMTAAERAMANMTYEMEDQIDMVDRRLEWMAASALSSGTVTLVGEGFETTVVDFQRDAALTVTLAGSAVWGDASHIDAQGNDTKPDQDLEDWATLVLQKSGAVVTDLVFTPLSWKLFKNSKNVKGAIFFPSLSPSGNEINPGTQVKTGAVYKGRWGQFDLWLYNDWFVDPVDNIEKPMFVDGTLILSGQEMNGVQAFGVVLDEDVGFPAIPYAPKTWVEKNPGVRHLLMQSAPIVVPTRANASMRVKVA